MANFDPICLWVLRQEDSTLSGVVKNLNDGGGLTRYGIAQTKHEALPPDFYVAAPSIALTYAKVIYKGEYWDRFLGDEILSDDVASCLLSFAINDGDAREVKMLQQALNIPADGIMGSLTLSRVNAANSAVLASTLRTEQGDFYLTLSKVNPTIARDLPGLMARAHRVYPSLV